MQDLDGQPMKALFIDGEEFVPETCLSHTEVRSIRRASPDKKEEYRRLAVTELLTELTAFTGLPVSVESLNQALREGSIECI